MLDVEGGHGQARDGRETATTTPARGSRAGDERPGLAAARYFIARVTYSAVTLAE